MIFKYSELKTQIKRHWKMESSIRPASFIISTTGASPKNFQGNIKLLRFIEYLYKPMKKGLRLEMSVNLWCILERSKLTTGSTNGNDISNLNILEMKLFWNSTSCK